MKTLTIQEVERTAFVLAQEHLAFNEPIPDFSTRFPHILESCIATPFMKYNKRYLYKGLTGKAAMLLYLVIKNHPFQNGNKRIALTTTLLYLAKNGKWIEAKDSELYELTLWVARSPSVVKDATVKGIETFFKKHLINFEQNQAGVSQESCRQ
jgi:death-on-curing protein